MAQTQQPDAQDVPQVFFTAVDTWKKDNGLLPPDYTCVPSPGYVHAARIDWSNRDLQLIDISNDERTWKKVQQLEDSTLFTIIRLPDAISSPAWSELHAELQPKIAAIIDKTELTLHHGCTRSRLTFPEAILPLRQNVLDALRTFDGGDNCAVCTITGGFLYGRMDVDFEGGRVDIADLGTLTPEPDWAYVQELAQKISDLADRENVVLTDSPFEFLKGLVVTLDDVFFEPPFEGEELG